MRRIEKCTADQVLDPGRTGEDVFRRRGEWCFAGGIKDLSRREDGVVVYKGLVVPVRGVVEDPIARADDEPIRTCGPPRDSQARSKLLLVGEDQRPRRPAGEPELGTLVGGSYQATSVRRGKVVVGSIAAEGVVLGIG